MKEIDRHAPPNDGGSVFGRSGVNVKIFVYKNNYYLYDQPSNQLVHLDQNTCQKIAEKTLNNKDLMNFQQHNLLTENSPEELSFFDGMVFDDSNFDVHAMQFIITEDCNFRCTYCVYSGKYKGQRTHSKKRLTFEQISKAIQTVSKYFKNNTIIIGFYGGEPLIEFNTIRKTVNYINELNKTVSHTLYKKNIEYVITTNGSLLDNEKIQYLKENNFKVLISFDGPSKIHDRYRKFRNGKNTYERVLKNITQIKEDHPDFFPSIAINIVVTEFSSITEILDYFSDQSSIFGESTLQFAGIMGNIDKSFEKPKTSIDERLPVKIFFSLLKKVSTNDNKLSTKDLIKYRALFELFGEKIKFFQKNEHINSKKIYLSNMCIPGASTTFVSPDGEFFFCRNSLSSMPIGNIIKGYDFNSINKIIAEYIDILKTLKCKNCWHINICKGECQFSAIENNKYSFKHKKEDCLNKMENTMRNMEYFIDFYDYFNDPEFKIIEPNAITEI